MSCMDRPPKKKKKNGPWREVTVKEEVDVSSEVRLNIKNMRGWLVYIAHQHRAPNE